MVCLQDTYPGVKMLDALDLGYKLTSGRRCLLRTLVPDEPPTQAPQTTYIMQEHPKRPPPQVTTKKEVTPAEIWDLQQLSLSTGCEM